MKKIELTTREYETLLEHLISQLEWLELHVPKTYEKLTTKDYGISTQQKVLQYIEDSKKLEYFSSILEKLLKP